MPRYFFTTNSGKFHFSFESTTCMESTSLGDFAASPSESLEDKTSQLIRLRAIGFVDQQFLQFAKEELFDILGPSLRLLSSKAFGPTRRYVSDVLVLEPGSGRRQLLDWIDGSAPDHPGGFLGHSEETTHVHLFHDCPYSNGSCRCRFKNHGLIRKHLKKSIRRPRFLCLYDWIDWVYILIYFLLSKRGGKKKIWVDGRIRRLLNHDQDLRWQNLCEGSRKILERQREGDGPDFEQEGPSHEEGKQTVPGRLRTSNGKRSRFENICAITSILLKKYLCIPLIDVRKIILPCNPGHNLTLHDPVNQRHYESACKLFAQSINSMSLLELKNLLENSTPVFYSNSATNPFKYYHTREESFEYLHTLLKFQFNDDEDKIKDLLFNIVSWFNKKGWFQLNSDGEYSLNSKINTICVIGPPNAGKNYFWDCFCAIALNTGHIGRVNNKCNQFALQEVVDRRLIIGNEINMEDGAKDDFKKTL
ncbi:Non-capsid protein NS-1 [Araneus ventricosus]|uniref:Non-capsid protein NS-1 n=1 Tax=Araneus ventricosus TaxID=182803 RepID=A0A4Y2NJL6_ARAVE|nr:Non-capsid protein NS-1 [Araneus ventricosus]GBN38217.1 Non-capsid protein NS-1 [Araneus ventricosus]